MKKLLLTTITVLNLSISFSQTYHPMLDTANIWYYSPNIIAIKLANSSSVACTYGNYPFSSNKLYTTSDTLINGISYKELIYDDYFNSNTCTFGYLREDTASRKVYFMDNLFSPEIVEYDFSMIVGDSIPLNFYVQGGGTIFENGYYRLDSIGAKSIAAGTRSTYYLNCHSCGSSTTLEWIESVGFQGHVVYTHGPNYSSFGFFNQCFYSFNVTYPLILTCFEHNQKVYLDSCAFFVAYQNFCFDYHDSCNYWNICGDVHEIPFVSSVSINPNPSNDKFTVFIVSSKTETIDFIIRDSKNREVARKNKNSLLNGNNRFELSTDQLINGFYSLECKSQRGSVFKKIIVMKK